MAEVLDRMRGMKMEGRRRFPRPREQPWLWCILLFAVVVLAAQVAGVEIRKPDMLVWNSTASLPRGLYLAIPKEPAAGDIVVFEPTELERRYAVARGYLPRPNANFLKRVGAMPGDIYRVAKDGTFTINGAYIGQAEERDSKDRPLPQLVREVDYVVPSGEFLPITNVTRSFDGRYTGTVPLKNIKSVVIPLLTAW